MNQYCTSLMHKNMGKEKKEGEKRANPEEEFFHLSCLALKIKYSESQDHTKISTPDGGGDDNFDVFTISEGKLFRLCQKKKIPFHSWHDWIDDQFERVM